MFLKIKFIQIMSSIFESLNKKGNVTCNKLLRLKSKNQFGPTILEIFSFRQTTLPSSTLYDER